MRRLLKKLREKATCELEEREEEKEIEDMMDKVEANQMIKQNNSGHSLKPKKITICQEFNLTKPRVKKIRFIQKVEKRPKVKKVRLADTKTLKEIEEEKQMRRKQIRQETKSEHARSKKVKLQSEMRSKMRLSQKRTYDVEKENEGQFEIKNFLKKDKNVDPRIHDRELFLKVNKNNKGAILKEARILERREEESRQKMRDLEMCMRDSTEFNDWKLKQEEREEAQRKKVLRDRKEEFEAGMLRVKEKTQKMKENKTLNCMEIKREKKKEAKKREKMKKKESVQKEKKRKEVQEGREKVKQVRKEVFIEKGVISEAVREQKNLDKERVKQGKIKELMQRRKLIQQIRECEKNLKVLMKDRKSNRV